MADLGPYPEYDVWLARMADAQRYKLRKNRKKGFLGDVPLTDIIKHLREEVDELEDALTRGSEIEAILEAAKVGNFAMAALIAAFGGKINVSTRTEGNELCAPVVDCPSGQGAELGGTQLLYGDLRAATSATPGSILGGSVSLPFLGPIS